MHSTYQSIQRASKALFPQGGWKSPGTFVRLKVRGVLHARLIAQACNYTGPGNLAQDPANESEFWGLLVWPLIDARWRTERRIEEFMRHYREAAKLGDLLELRMDETRPILKLDSVCETLEVCLERRTWWSREGQATLSLFYAGERMYSVSFQLSSHNGMRIAYIGAIQGAKQAEDSEAHKIVNKAAHGLRPRDLTIALFQLLCEAMRVSQIHAVQDQNRQHRYFRGDDNPKVFADYNTIWTENGGVLNPDGMYAMASGVRHKDLAEVASKKRSMYRKRQTMLEEAQAALHLLVQHSMATGSRYAVAETASASAPQRQPSGGIIETWVAKVRPGVFGSWLWSFPAVFM